MTSAPTMQPSFLPSRNELGVVAVGFSGGQTKSGVDAAPMALIEAGLIQQLETDLDFKVTFDGQVHSYTEIMPAEDPDYRNMKKPKSVSAVTRAVSQQVYEHASAGRFVLTLGGDHSIAIGTISGTAKATRERIGRDIAVIWVDAHADLNTPETSESGNIHGMPVAFLTGLAKEDREDCFGWIKDDHRINVPRSANDSFRRYGIGKVMDMALGWIGSDTPIHLSFDVDAIDPMWAPSTGTPVRGGLTLREGDFIAECVAETGSLIALDLVEVNPSLEEAALDTSLDGRERVVVLGSGWAGYTVARRLDSKKYQVVVVSPRSYFAFTPLLASTAVGTLEFRTALEPVRSRRTKVSFFQGWADAVDFKSKRVTIEEAVEDPNQGLALTGDRHGGKSMAERTEEKKEEAKKGQLFDIKYDKLVIAVGCYSQTFGTPGVREHALFLKDVGDARKIRNRLLACFETAALPTTSEEMRKNLLNFAIVGGGPTGIEFSAELHDFIKEDLAKLYPDLMKHCSITVYDVAPKVLSMFDEKLGKYAMQHFKREGIAIKTSHHVKSLRLGVPKPAEGKERVKDKHTCWTLDLKEEGEVGVGMVVWSTGLMMNPFISNAIGKVQSLPDVGAIVDKDFGGKDWFVKKDPRSGGVITDDRLRVVLEPEGEDAEKPKGDKAGPKPRAVLEDVFAIGDCAILEGTTYPATAQVANQKAEWLAKRLNKGDLERQGFHWKNMGVMAYVGSWNAIMQSDGRNISGRAAWIIWRGAYLTKSVSLRNKILIPTYW
ncbi:hypothetical protein H2199_000830 [Coniosporium tulheliwenetii]|uniref:Uncharacterized protein n=1 Tax=Coniosporium tulheliwenetii TaxID=3383036 RepID=A0ACC2ZN42_9PEZI|nr:hypothetical protein H2199_000830 [Cladosporium sp. JES 115]